MGRAINDADTGGKAPPPAFRFKLTLGVPSPQSAESNVPNRTVVAYDEFYVKEHDDGSITITIPRGEVTTSVNP
jgi:hypothetical protein